MKKLTITDRQLFIAGMISIALIATGSMIGAWIGTIGLCAVSIIMMSDPFEATELQGQLCGEEDEFISRLKAEVEASKLKPHDERDMHEAEMEEYVEWLAQREEERRYPI